MKSKPALKDEPLQGIQFLQDSSAKRSSTAANKTILSAALKAVNPKAAAAVDAEKNIRKQYPLHFRALVETGIQSTSAALSIAKNGLQSTWEQVEFIRQGQASTLADAMKQPSQDGFKTLTLQGQGSSDIAPLVVPYHGVQLQGQELRTQIARWERAGIIEPSHAQALNRCLDHPEWFDLSDRTMVLFGAASEAGPLSWLAKWRSNIVAIDIPNQKIWQKLVNTVSAGNAKLTAPISPEIETSEDDSKNMLQAGCNLLTQTPEIAAWLKSFKQPLDLAAIAYLDGERHVRVSIAMDAIMTEVSQAKPDSTLMYMSTPTDIFAIHHQTATAAEKRFNERNFGRKLLTNAIYRATRHKFFLPNTAQLITSENGNRYGIADCLVIEQGPNYALAKRIQQWRAIVARDGGQRVCLNVAPSTTTASVTKNPILKAAFNGADIYKVEAFSPETTNAIMAALWVHDLRCDDSAANPAKVLANPLELIMEGANHGGLWRVAYLARTALPVAAAVGWVKSKAIKKR